MAGVTAPASLLTHRARGCNVIYHLKQFSLSYAHFNPDIQLCISPQNSDLKQKMDATIFGGVIEIGRYIDFHYAESTTDYDGRLYLDTDGVFKTNKGVLAYQAELDQKAWANYYKGADANTFSCGLYLAERCTNTPDATTWWFVISFVYPTLSTGAQLAYGLLNKKLKCRSYASGKWGEWGDTV